jgi:hypothetical protein
MMRLLDCPAEEQQSDEMSGGGGAGGLVVGRLRMTIRALLVREGIYNVSSERGMTLSKVAGPVEEVMNWVAGMFVDLM